MIIRKEWLIKSIWKNLIEAVILYIVFQIFALIPSAQSLRGTMDMLNTLLNLVGILYIYKVMNKKTWIMKELFVSAGGLMAAVITNNQIGIMTYSAAVSLVIMRKIRRKI